jgi:Tfp pilus assembly protein PilO
MGEVVMNEKQKLMVAAAVAAAIAIGLAYLIYVEYGTSVEALETTANVKKGIQLAEAKIKEIPGLEAERNRLAAVVEEYVRILPDEKEVEALLETLSELKDKAGLAPDAITSFTFTQEPIGTSRSAASANFQKYVRQVRLRATLFQFADFVNRLERYKRFIQVDSFSLRPQTEGTVHDINMQMSTFTYSRAKKK